MTVWRRFRVGVALAAAAALVAPFSACGTTPSSGDLPARVVQRWIALQLPDGSFRDHVLLRRRFPGSDQYGPAMLGYAFLQEGITSGDRRVQLAGLRAIGFALRHPYSTSRLVFDDLALASAYNIARRRLAQDHAFAQLRRSWEARLRGMSMPIFRSARRYFNLYLVQSLAVLELLQSGLRSSVPGSVLADPRSARRAVLDVVGLRLRAEASLETTSSAVGPLTLIGDPPAQPLAYHAFSLALLGRILALLGPAAPASARVVQAQAARASWALMSPSGDVAYFGRSMELAWALSMTAAGVDSAAAAPGTPPADVTRNREVAQRAMQRLSNLYAGGSFGLWIAPSLRDGVTAGVRGLDPYVAAASYTALTLVGMEWASDALRRVPRTAADAGPDPTGAVQLGRGSGAFAVVRTRDEWFAVRMAPATHVPIGADYTTDLRYDAGLVALERRSAAGDWTSVLPARPLTYGEFDGAGPLLRRAGRIARPVGARLELASDGSVILDGAVRLPDGRALRALTVRYEPTACGVEIVFAARPGEHWEWSTFFAGTPRLTSPGTVEDGTQEVSVSAPAQVAFQRGYASAVDATLTRARFSFAAGHGGAIVISVCGSGR